MAKTLKRTLSQRKSKLYEDILYSCTVRFLDDSDPLTVTYQKEQKGQWLIDHVCRELNLEEKDYFGLRFVDTEKQRHWLDPLKPVYKQLKQVSPCVLCFRVKFYPADPAKLKEELTRYFLFLQLKRDLHHGRLLCLLQDANLLAAYIIQSECGDYNPEDHPDGYVSKHKMLPKQTAKQEEKIAELHKTITGQTPADAETNFITKSASLDTYGVDPHPVKNTVIGIPEKSAKTMLLSRNKWRVDQKGNQMYLGVTHLGIVTFQGNKRTHLFKWPQISKIAFEGKMFIVHVTISEDSENSTLVKKKKHACGFKCATFTACKHLWKCAKEQQYFFTLDRATEAPKVTSGGGFFSRGTKFRFSGRCQKEVYNESSKISRLEPRFIRSCSNPSIVRSYNKMRTDSLPNSLKNKSLNDSNVRSTPELTKATADDFSTSTPFKPTQRRSVRSEILPQSPLSMDSVIDNDNSIISPTYASTDSSMQSLTHGEIDFDITPNGDIKEIQEGFPKEDPIEVSDKPYEPIRSPTPDSPIQSIPENDDESEPDPDASPVARKLEKQLNVEGDDIDDSIEIVQPISQEVISPQNVILVGSLNPDSLSPETTNPLAETRNDNPTSDQTSVMSLHPTETVDDNHTSAEQQPDIDSPVENQPVPPPMYEQGLRCCKILTWTFLLMFTIMSIVAIFVLESELDMPVLRDIRQMPEVQDFKHQHYNPFKTTATKKMGGWFK